MCCTQIDLKGSIFIKCPCGSIRSKVLKSGVSAIPGHCLCKDWHCVCKQAPLITVNWYPAQSAFPWICSRCRVSDGINNTDAQKMVTVHSASGLDGCI